MKNVSIQPYGEKFSPSMLYGWILIPEVKYQDSLLDSLSVYLSLYLTWIIYLVNYILVRSTITVMCHLTVWKRKTKKDWAQYIWDLLRFLRFVIMPV